MDEIILKPKTSSLTGYLAPQGFKEDLIKELELMGQKIELVCDHLIICEGALPPQSIVAFAQDIWFDLCEFHFTSISKAADHLKGLGVFWSHYSFKNHRRGELILGSIPKARPKVFQFLEEVSPVRLGYFLLLSENVMLYSSKTRSELPFGEMHFHEDKINPPSRAYLKLWELMTLYKIKPKAGEKVLDMGSCPGGWTWVLQSIRTKVLSVDKAPLDPRIMALPQVEFHRESAFGLRPSHIGAADWFFSDIICYPKKLYELVNRFREHGQISHFVCTIKFQRPTDFETLFAFKEIPNSQIYHLYCNKHEVTWINLKSEKC